MSTALNRQQKPEKVIKLQEKYEPKYQEFIAISPQQSQLEDVIFFARIATFAISTVLICFLFLVQGLVAFWSFGLALLLSSGVVVLTSQLLKYLLEE